MELTTTTMFIRQLVEQGGFGGKKIGARLKVRSVVRLRISSFGSFLTQRKWLIRTFSRHNHISWQTILREISFSELGMLTYHCRDMTGQLLKVMDINGEDSSQIEKLQQILDRSKQSYMPPTLFTITTDNLTHFQSSC